MIADTEYRTVVAFIYTEARLADESRYAEWEALWDDDAVYWVPASPTGDTDPTGLPIQRNVTRRPSGLLRDWGNGHSEIEWAPGYQRPFDWCGGGSETKFAAYVSAMEKSYGKAVTQQRIFDGPAHALIFPNLFLGEMNILFFEASSVDEAVHWHTPMFLKGVPEFNKRLLRQSEGAMGPASFILPEDVTVAGRPLNLAVSIAPITQYGLDTVLFPHKTGILCPNDSEKGSVGNAEMIAVCVILWDHFPVGMIPMLEPARAELNLALRG